MGTVFFDHNSTAALNAEVLKAMLPFMTHQHGNATSRHTFGRTSRAAIEQAREQVATAVNAHPSQVIFTASGTEANNFAIRGMVNESIIGQILTSAVEHPCVSGPALAMRSSTFQANRIKVDANCKLDLSCLRKLLPTPTQLVSVMLANNETGVIQDIKVISEIARAHKTYMHTDAVQGLGKISVDFESLNVHAMTISSHKIGGPLGAGALVLDKRIDIKPLLHGGGQERGLRSGTENISAIVGFGVACDLAVENLVHFAQHTQLLRDYLEAGLIKLKARLFANHAKRLPNTSFFAFEHIDGETLVMALDRKGFAVASGSACSSDNGQPSHVLLAMGVNEELARSAIRVSFGMSNTIAEVQQFLDVLQNELVKLRSLTAMAV